MTRAEELVLQAELGIEALVFQESKLGRALIANNDAAIEELTEQLKTADPFDSKEIMRLQNEISKREIFPYFLGQCIDGLHNAESEAAQLED